jgi:magnesium and cobalt transporter
MQKEQEHEKTWINKILHSLSREPKDQLQLVEILQQAKDNNLLNSDALKMIQGVLQVSDLQVKEVMVPRPKMVVVEADMTLEQALPIIIESGHSRFPVIAENRDEISGILLAKDLLNPLTTQKNTSHQVKNFIRKAIFIPENKKLDILLNEFRLQRYHIAMIVDEYGTVSGLVTIENLLEQIVGKIEDEFDAQDETESIKKIKHNEYLIDALTPIAKFNKYFLTNYETDLFDTIGGMVLHKFSHIPKQGEIVTIDKFTIQIVKTHSRRIQQLRVTKQDNKV